MATMPTRFQSFSNAVQQFRGGHPEIVSRMAACIHLRYKEQTDAVGNVCMIDSDEVRPEFKDSFTFEDIVNYLYGSFHLALHNQKTEKEFLADFPYPENSEAFWRLVKSGEELGKTM